MVMFLRLENSENYTVVNEQSGKDQRTKKHMFSQAQTSGDSSWIYNVVIILNTLIGWNLSPKWLEAHGLHILIRFLEI